MDLNRLENQKIEKEGPITTVRFSIEVFLHQEAYYTKVVPRLLDVLNVIAVRKNEGTVATRGEFSKNYNSYEHNVSLNLPINGEKELAVAVNIGRNQNLTSLRWQGFILPIDLYAEVLKAIYAKAPKLRIACLDAENRVINEREVTPNRINGNEAKFNYYPFFVTKYFLPNIIAYRFLPLVLTGENSRVVTVKDSFTFYTDMEFSLEELGRMNDIKLYFVPNTVER